MRGADPSVDVPAAEAEETSPHAWSRSDHAANKSDANRNISTCVEQITLSTPLTYTKRKHLHMRGADKLIKAGPEHRKETSPHAWSR